MIPSSNYFEDEDHIVFDANLKKMAEELDLIRRAGKPCHVDCSSFDFLDDVERYIAAGAIVTSKTGLRRLGC